MTRPAGLPVELAPLLDSLAGTVETLLLTGLTTASETTRQSLQVALREASRHQLLRLASTLRIANDELGRFTRQDAGFSCRRLMFFLNRTWLLARGVGAALRSGDQAAFDRLMRTPPSHVFSKLEVVTLGATKKIATGAFVAFEFRLRTVAPARTSGPEGERLLPEGQRLAWSAIFPIKPDFDIPAEGFLHLPQKQKFYASVFLERRRLSIEQVAVAVDELGLGRVSLRDESRVTAGEPFVDWSRFADWDPRESLAVIERHVPGPFDLEIELQEEIVLRNWKLGEPTTRPQTGQKVYPLTANGVEFDAVVAAGVEGEALDAALELSRTSKKTPAPLFGLLHYEMCRLVLQPLSLLDRQAPAYLTISPKNIDRSLLLKGLKF